ncbi:uncharacterized protein LOC121296103 isoform X3 [Polyodon spathula]|uniref:uncharacterized protein LOC121296103 isoform X3 n=1 Tax=Polyodon spathula TaxID=7913 RepID=UPI001B7E8BD3|nr:uncharacterized protein LOC121296103 isoform X3 [Polyodon spathula]
MVPPSFPVLAVKALLLSQIRINMITLRMGLPFTSTTLLLLLLILGLSKGQMEEEEKLKDVTPPLKRCICELQNLGATFPWQEFQTARSFSSNCTQTLTKQEFIKVDSLLGSLYYRLQNLEKDVKNFEAEFDTGLYSVISLRIIEIELTEILNLLLKLNQTSHNKKAFQDNLAAQMQTMADKIKAIEQFDRMHVVKRQQESKRLKRSLNECEAELKATPAPVTTPVPDIDLTTDESGLWVIYTSQAKFGNIILSRLDAGNLTLLQTWYTSLQKKIITNAFMACGVLYATRFIDSSYDEVFYSFDTITGVERSTLAIPFKKISTNIQHLNYNPRNRMLYVYNDAYILSYQAVFG